MTKISVLIPVYNVENYIIRCLNSVLENQSVKEFQLECIIIDDCGTDRSMTLVENYISENKNASSVCRIIKNETNKGLASSRNVALDACTGDFVLHLDSDDYLEKDALTKLYVALAANPEADIVMGNVYFDYSDYKFLCHDYYPNLQKDYLNSLLVRKSMVNIWGKLIRKSLYIDNNIRCISGVNQGEDYSVYPKLVYFAKKIVKIEDPVYNYYQANINSYTKNVNHIGAIQQIFMAQDTIIDFFADKIDSKLIDASVLKTKISILVMKATKSDYKYLNTYRNEISVFNPYIECKHIIMLLLLKLKFHNIVYYLMCNIYKHKVS